MVSKVVLTFHGIFFLFLLLGIYDVLLNYESNQCEMSYMWETPKYKEVPILKNVSVKYPRYGLYLYGEGHYYDVTSNLQLAGIPVLYIPGNGGSKKQARSVASFVLRKALKKNWNPHFNVFTVDLNEEMVAFYGATLNDQVGFVHESIKAIFELYANSPFEDTKPKSIILIGHSMGGMIARGLFTIPGFNPKLVNTVITLATPHVHPVISLDTHISSFYDSVNIYWRENCDKLKDVTILSVSGGDRDFQVDGAVTRLPSCRNNSLSTTSTAIPRAWVSADHQCAVWCKQVVLATTRSFFDMVDPKTNQITEDPSLRMKAIRYHFEHNPGFSNFSELEKSKLKPASAYVFKNVDVSKWSLSADRQLSESTYFVFNVREMQEQGKTFLVARTTISKNHWILASINADFISLTDLSSRGYLTPKYKVIHLDINELIEDNYNYVLISVPKSARKTADFDVNFLNPNDSTFNLTTPHIFSNLWTQNRGLDSNITLGMGTLQFYYRINPIGLHSIFHAYKVTISPLTSHNVAPPLLQLDLPGHPSSTYGLHGNKTIKLKFTSGTEVPTLHVYADGATEYKVNIKVQFVELLGQIMRFHGVSIVTMIVLNAMLTYSYQMKLTLAEGSSPSTSIAHETSAKPYKIQPFVNLVKALYGYQTFSYWWLAIGLPVPDSVLIDNEYKIWFAIMSLVMFVYAFEVFLILIYSQNKLISISSRLFSRYLADSTNTSISFQSTVAHTVIMGVFASFSGGFVLLYILLLSFINLCSLRCYLNNKENENKIKESEEIEKSSSNGDQEVENKEKLNDKSSSLEKQTDEDHEQSNYHLMFTIHQMWLFLTVLSVPSMIACFKGYSFLSSDPSLPIAIIASLVFLLQRQQDAFMKPSKVRKILCRLLYPLTIMVSILCLVSLHRLPYFILSFMALSNAMQFLG